jgi:DNA topoisomerase-1
MTVVERLQSSGIRRRGSPKSGFQYRRPDGSVVPRRERERIQALVLPPAWTDVYVSPSPASAVQAIGRDRAGRWQYYYSEKQTRRREALKRARLLAFLRALPGLRARLAQDLRREGLCRERVLAAMTRLLLRGFLRPGSQVYAKENGTYGLATLRPRHVRVRGRQITLAYPGKGGKAQVREIVDAPAARVVRALLVNPGREVFRYRNDDGTWVNVRRRHLNAYLREVTGAPITAKDFRTWAGTLFGACALARAGYPAPASARAIRRAVAQAMRETAELLGNTPTVCRASYVSPGILTAFEGGRLLADAPTMEALVRASPRALASVERRLARLITNGNGTRSNGAGSRAKRPASARP